MKGGADMYEDAVFLGGNYREEDFFDEDYDRNGEDSEDFFGGARKKRSTSMTKKADDSSKHSFSVAYVDVGSYNGGHFVSSTATNAAKKAATAIFRHIDLESGAAKPPKNAKGQTKMVSINASLKEKYGKKPISGVSVHFVILRKERKSLPKYYAYVAKRVKLSNPVETKKVGTRPAIKYEYKVELKADKLPAKFEAENEEFKKKYNSAKRAKKAGVEKKMKKVASPKKAAAKKTGTKKVAKKAASGKSTPKKAKKASGVELDDIIKALSNSGQKKASPPKKVAAKKTAAKKPKRAASPKPKRRSASPKPKRRAASPKPKRRAASPKPKKASTNKKPAQKKMKGGGDLCSFF